ncbi:succinate dehydrogenase cytochrome b subunit [Egicoccus halophilus]|uniref:Succinate dehydrogenase n=1 Tax=Egicoccus halophilus TaxID=1670830 RepID=A0A8J3ACM1_9ACTN|nr:succinate dehydrogenase cytochrome b subunit [Egicoccus halophilus]GGI03827.1 succinate dehydrogenase [Egicoccus halophilus]
MATKVTGVTQGGPPNPAGGKTRRPFLVDLYGSAVGKKYIMAITGMVWLGYVFAHMVGNLKVYLGAEDFNHYAEFLRAGLLVPIVPEEGALWGMRVLLLVTLFFHILAAYQLTVMNRNARPERYQARREFVAADFAARTMRWTGVIVLLFLLFHIADLTLGWVNPAESGATPYEKLVASFRQPVVAAFYVLANLALGIHIYHGGWSLFQSMGWNNRKFNHWRRAFAIGFAVVVVGGNVTFPLAVQFGIVS